MEIELLFKIAILSIAVTIVFSVTNYIKRKNIRNGNKIKGNHNKQIIGDGNTTTNVHIEHLTNNNFSSTHTQKESYNGNNSISNADMKDLLKVLFVDDKTFAVIRHLKSIGWKQVSHLKDITNIDDPVIQEAHIIFLDINGVGKALRFSNQGMGLCGALKRKYGNKKRVVLYSGETDGSIFDKDARMADATLKKDSDILQFTSLIEQYGKELLQKTN